MENLFNFDYELEIILNKDIERTDSRFGIVYGENGMVIHTKKDSYTMVKTADVNEIGQRFIEDGMKVTSFSQRFGEIIGLNVDLVSKRKTIVGDKDYNALITIPNNGNGSGHLSIFENVLICTNGMTRSSLVHKDKSIKIPHNITYKISMELMAQAITAFKSMIKEIEKRDEKLNSQPLGNEDAAVKLLNKWFYDFEMPVSQKTMTFDEFRKMLYDQQDELKSYDRYCQMKDAFYAELGHNQTLNRPLSLYTIYATVTNYLSRRREDSQSSAPVEIQTLRQEQKVKSLEHILI